MEVASRTIDSTSPKVHRSASAFDAEPREFQQWISDQNSDRRYRIDIPIECDTASTAKYSLYGFCQPIRNAPGLPIIPSAMPTDSEQRDRLVRLLERQQEWYDARESARLRAEQYLDIIDQHQQQWLNHQPSNRPARS